MHALEDPGICLSCRIGATGSLPLRETRHAQVAELGHFGCGTIPACAVPGAPDILTAAKLPHPAPLRDHLTVAAGDTQMQ